MTTIVPDDLTPGTYTINCPTSPFEYLTYDPQSGHPYMLHTITDRATVLALFESGFLCFSPRSPQPRPRGGSRGLAVVR